MSISSPFYLPFLLILLLLPYLLMSPLHILLLLSHPLPPLSLLFPLPLFLMFFLLLSSLPLLLLPLILPLLYLLYLLLNLEDLAEMFKPLLILGTMPAIQLYLPPFLLMCHLRFLQLTCICMSPNFTNRLLLILPGKRPC